MSMTEFNIKDYLALVSRPSRYIGGEINSTKKDLSNIRLKFGLAFPDVYEIGMSHLGMQILYQILNNRPDIACERVFSPWVDMERLLRERQTPLTTLESGIPLNKLDVLGFSIQYELSYTNILNILNLGNIPLYSKERNEKHPLIIGGGPIAFNPEPIADFFDIFVLGDGEEVILEIADCIIEWKNTRKKREDLFKRLAQIEGVYVPSFFDVKYHADGRIREIIPLVKDYEGVKKRMVPDINALPLPARPIVPFPQIVHDHLSVEINRGCTRGCRFCQAGMIYRPNRERSPEKIAAWIEEALKNTGYDEVSFLSLSAGDYSCIEDVLIGFMDMFADKKIAVSLPSLRVGTLNPRLIEEIKKVRKTGFTMAPEAGSERLRNVINKGIQEDALIETARNAFEAGWRAIKLYYMTGLPTETVDDIRGIVELSRRVQEAGERGRSRPTVNVSVSQFIPKPHTPFQWEPQIRLEDSLERQSFLKQELKKKLLDFKWHDARMSFLEGIFSRGDRRLASVIKTAFDVNCRFDSWGDQFKFDVWGKIFKDAGIDPEFYTYRRRDRNEIFPWHHLNARVDKEFLYKEYERSLRKEETPDCKTDTCSVCGVCDHKVIKNVAFYEKSGVKSLSLQAVSRGQRSEVNHTKKPPAPSLQPPTFKIRLTFSKTSDMKYLGHLEMATAFYRAIRRADIPIAHSLGFHPLPKIVFGQPLPVGVESIAENADIELKEHMKPEDVLERLNSTMPHGIKILEAKELLAKSYPVSQVCQGATYLVFLEKNSAMPDDRDTLEALINRLMEKDEVIIVQEREGKKRHINIRPLIKGLSLFDEKTIQLTLGMGEKGSVKPHEVIAHILGLSQDDRRLLPILKIKGKHGGMDNRQETADIKQQSRKSVVCGLESEV